MTAMKSKNHCLNTLRIVTAIIALCVAGSAYVLPVDADLDEGIGQKEYDCGIELMRIMGIPEGQETPVFSAWTFPTSIVVQGVAYRVKLSENIGEFQLMASTNHDETVLTGSIVRMRNGTQCRRAAFGRMAMSSLGVRAMACCTQVHYPLADSNTLYLTRSLSAPRRIGILGCRNLMLAMESQSVTNIIEYSLALLNAGLPGSERLSLPRKDR